MGDSTLPISTNIPVVDFSGFLQGSTATRQRTVQAIFQACHQVGFLYLKNHGIPLEAIDQVFDQSRIFFDLPITVKQRAAWSSEYNNLGYVGLERECLDEDKPGDLKEAFNIGQGSLSAVTIHHSANLWPTEQPLFRQTMNTFFGLCAAATEQIFQAFACALSMPADYLVKHHQTQDYTLRLLHYPPLTTLPRAGQLRAGTHSDYGSLTLLFQDNVGGLEVQTTQGDWITAPTIANTVLINTGDLMQRWSNNVFRSTKHRVKLPSSPQTERYSIAFFCQPDAETDIVCLPTCHSPQNPPKYAPVKSGEYLLSRLRATY